MLIGVEITAGAAALAFAGTAVRRFGHRRSTESEPEPVRRSSPAFRLLRSDDEVHRALERAITYEWRSIRRAEERAERFAAMHLELEPRSAPRLAPPPRLPLPPPPGLAAAPSASPAPAAEKPALKRPRPTRVPRVS